MCRGKILLFDKLNLDMYKFPSYRIYCKVELVTLLIFKVECMYVSDLGNRLSTRIERERSGKQDRITNSDNVLNTFTMRTVASSTIDSNRKTSVLRGYTAEGKTPLQRRTLSGAHTVYERITDAFMAAIT